MRESEGSPKSLTVGAKVLLVEDDGDARDAVTEVLVGEGLDVLAADEGRKALELMEAWRPAVVLLDLHMKGMGGREFREEQKRRGRLARIPVVIMTGDPDGASLGDVVLAKPFSMEQLLATVARFVPELRRPEAAPSS